MPTVRKLEKKFLFFCNSFYENSVLSLFQTKMVQTVFGAWDYAIMVATMVASVAIGLYFRFSGGKQKTNEVTTPFLVLYIMFIYLRVGEQVVPSSRYKGKLNFKIIRIGDNICKYVKYNDKLSHNMTI